MALSASTVFEINSSATAANVNGGGFNPANAGMLTNLAATVATGSAPVCTSASYNFVAADVGNWLYIQSGTNWTPGWYKIASVSANAATLSAAVGSANVIQIVNNRYGPNTVAGCATTASPTAGTFTIDYSQSTACITSTSVSDYSSTISSTTMTSATAAFTPVMVGNLFHLNNAGTGSFGIVGWYEIATYVNATTVTTDRTTNSGTAMVAGQGKIGGALSLASSDDAVFELATSSATAASRFFIKGNATYTLGGTVNIAAAGNVSWPVNLEGYNATRGDRPVDSTRPIFDCGVNAFTFSGTSWNVSSLVFTGTNATVVTGGSNMVLLGCKFINTSVTAARKAISLSTNGLMKNCEAICYRGIAITVASSSGIIQGSWFHDSDTGVSGSGTVMSDSIISGCVTSALTGSITASSQIFNCTFYGAENKLGIGLNALTGSTSIHFLNNIIYGFVTGVSHADVNTAGFDNNNNYFNNTNDVNAIANWQKGPNDTAINPAFTSVAQITGSTASSGSSNHFTQVGATFVSSGVVAGRDFLYIKSGTGITAGIYGILSVDSETQITTDIALASDATTDKVWQITTGQNFAIGTNLKATGTPGAFPGGYTTGYIDTGAVQRQEPTISSSSFTFS